VDYIAVGEWTLGVVDYLVVQIFIKLLCLLFIFRIFRFYGYFLKFDIFDILESFRPEILNLVFDILINQKAEFTKGEHFETFPVIEGRVDSRPWGYDTNIMIAPFLPNIILFFYNVFLF